MEPVRSPLPRGDSLCVGDVVLDMYRLDAELHRGPYVVVYRAFDLNEKQSVALKVLHRPSPREQQRAPFLRKAYQLANLNHPNVIKIHRLGWLAAGSAYYVMELLDEGETYLSWMNAIQEVTPLHRRQLAAIVAQVRNLDATLEPLHINSCMCLPKDLFLLRDLSAPESIRPKFLYLGIAPELPTELLNPDRNVGLPVEEFVFEQSSP